ncbi:preprotein translocase subunit SecG [Allopontixanthobacter sediminis]|uniref:Protein-export membrane protein SecG n=1 Tax=Allopontixanthobacter sediminis TaxID=1689985 RepID=A0A845AZ58_9SPHN|nr:preprotein translocase subunit SecG [Allopontixanthobacter sediminis]MXP43555.1 preprotein translocase subunit SecG [Allopontixanthobacter sediminis]
MSLFLFLTVLQAIVAAALVGVILMQRSEGGGLGIGGGGSPGGLMSARGAADFLTRATKWLAITFVVLSIVMAAVAVKTTTGSGITSTLDRTVPVQPDPLAGQAGAQPGAATGTATGPGETAPGQPEPAPADPLADVTQ